MPEYVRDDGADPGFVEAYRALPDATDLEPWLAWARAAGGPVLYLGPGTGRIAVPLWRAGIRLVGVDAHPGMIAVLRERLPEMELVRARFEELDLRRRFNLVIGPSSVLAGIPALRAAARHVAKRGRVAMELMNPHWLLESRQTRVRWRRLDADRVRIHVPYPSGAVQVADVDLRWPERIEEHLAAAGLELVFMDGGGSLDAASTYFVLAAGDLPAK